MEQKLYVVIGASGSGKSTLMPYLKRKIHGMEIVDFDDIGVPENASKKWRAESTEKWLQKFLLQNKDMVILGQMVLGEIISCPSYRLIKELKALLLDCNDVERINRLKKRGNQNIINQDMLNWSYWLRKHNQDPHWQLQVIKQDCWHELDFTLLDKINNWSDIFSSPNIMDNSDISISQTVALIEKLIKE